MALPISRALSSGRGRALLSSASGGRAKVAPRQSLSFWQAIVRVCVTFSLCVTALACWGWQASMGQRRDRGGAQLLADLAARNFSLARSPAAVHLEQLVDQDPMLGVCYLGRPQLPGVPDYVCRRLRCLWVEDLRVNIDLEAQALSVLPGPARGGQCDAPRGGQRPVPAGERPHVSFILTMFNHAGVTAQSLLELFRTSWEVPSAEYVVVDDGSTEDTAPLTQALWRLQEIFGVPVKFKRNEGSLGYGPANEQGIRLASGKYIALVNNDMFAVRGWLSAIFATFAANPAAGMVGPLFMGDRDLITEAGGLVFSDAAAANYMRGVPPHPGVYFARRTDYISAACVVIPREAYDRVGGFDPQYVMGYYEDTDLAMALRGAGYEVIFQPLAVNFHQEGTSFGTDETSELKRRLMAENKEKFFAKWRSTLEEKHCPSQLDFSLSFNRATYLRLLWVDEIVPEPDRDAASARANRLLRILLDTGYHVTLGTLTPGREPYYATRLRFAGAHVMEPRPPDRWTLSRYGRCAFDVIWVAHSGAFEAAQGQIQQHCPGLPVLFDTAGLQFLRESRAAISAGAGKQGMSMQGQPWDMDSLAPSRVLDWLEEGGSPEADAARRVRDVELYFVHRANLTVVLSPEEQLLIHHFEPEAKVAVVFNLQVGPAGTGDHSYGSAVQRSTACHDRAGALFVGSMGEAPNRQAVEVLIRDVLPLVLKSIPRRELAAFDVHVVGSGAAPDELRQLLRENRNVVYHGQLSDQELYDLYGKVRAAMAPLLSGAGMHGKVAEAMALGVPVVTTPLGIEGIDARDGMGALVASTAQQFSEKLVQLLSDCRLWQRLSAGGAAVAREQLGAAEGRAAFLEALRSIGRGPIPENLRGTCRYTLPSVLTRDLERSMQ